MLDPINVHDNDDDSDGNGDDEECRWRKLDFKKQMNLPVFLHFLQILSFEAININITYAKINKNIKIKL